MASEQEMKKIEELEFRHLEKYYHFLMYVLDEMLLGFNTKEKIKSDWIEKYASGISKFSVGAERIVYSLFNGKAVGQPNSAPVGSDLFFEIENAFIHIDLKTVELQGNIGDYTNAIFVGRNQNSYTGQMEVNKTKKNVETTLRDYESALPYYYSLEDVQKVCLTYFITILYDKENFKIININLVCMPNGALYDHYGSKVLQAGKNIDKTRFRFSEVPEFELLEGHKKRIKVVYYNDSTLSDSEKKKMHFIKSTYDSQKAE